MCVFYFSYFSIPISINIEEGNLAILVDAKREYTKQLVNILKGSIYQGIKKLYKESKDSCNDLNEPEKCLLQFQSNLSEIPKWNQEIINTECSRIIDESKCDWLEELITAVFVSHTRILTSINFSKNLKWFGNYFINILLLNQ